MCIRDSVYPKLMSAQRREGLTGISTAFQPIRVLAAVFEYRRVLRPSTAEREMTIYVVIACHADSCPETPVTEVKPGQRLGGGEIERTTDGDAIRPTDRRRSPPARATATNAAQLPTSDGRC